MGSLILKAAVTEADVACFGSITIDEGLIVKVNLQVNEGVLVVERTGGHRLQTHVIRGERGNGVVGMNGASAHLINKGSIVDIMSSTWSYGEIRPMFLEVDQHKRFSRYVTEGTR